MKILKQSKNLRKSKLKRKRKINSKKSRRTRKLNSRKLRKSRKKLSKKIAKKGGTSCRGHSSNVAELQKKCYKPFLIQTNFEPNDKKKFDQNSYYEYFHPYSKKIYLTNGSNVRLDSIGSGSNKGITNISSKFFSDENDYTLINKPKTTFESRNKWTTIKKYNKLYNSNNIEEINQSISLNDSNVFSVVLSPHEEKAKFNKIIKVYHVLGYSNPGNIESDQEYKKELKQYYISIIKHFLNHTDGDALHLVESPGQIFQAKKTSQYMKEVYEDIRNKISKSSIDEYKPKKPSYNGRPKEILFFYGENFEFLQNFIDAQKKGNLDKREYAIEDIEENQEKNGHWIWYIFPSMNLKGKVNPSDKNIKYSITSLNDAREYLKHPQLGKNLLVDLNSLSENQKYFIKGSLYFFTNLDIPKFISCILLFYIAIKSYHEFSQDEYKIFENILNRLIKEDSEILKKNLTIQTIFEGYPKINEIIDKQTLDKHIELWFYQPSS